MNSSNPWVRYVTHMYWARRLPQLAQLETVACGYATDEQDFYTRTERITFRDTLIRCSPEWRAMKGAA